MRPIGTKVMRNSRRGAVDPFIVMDVMEAARQAEASGRHIIHMEVGQPGTAAPERARHALAEAMTEDALGYTVALGIPALRARIAKLYGDWYNVDLDPARVVVTPGSSGRSSWPLRHCSTLATRLQLGHPGIPAIVRFSKPWIWFQSTCPHRQRIACNRCQMTLPGWMCRG